MVGRNDPCPCGSGKKHKKCCLGKNEVSIDQFVDDELNRIIHSFYEQQRGHSDITEFEQYSRYWYGKLGSLWDTESIESSVNAYFFFVARRDLWNRHIVKVLNSPIRGAVQSVIETWKDPLILFGKIKGEKNGFVEIEEILGDRLFLLKVKEGMSADKNSIVFGVVLHDNRIHSNGIHVFTSLMFIENEDRKFENKIVSLAESSGFGTSVDFYKEHMVDIYYTMLLGDTDIIEGLAEDNLTSSHLEALEVLDDTLKGLGVQEEARELQKRIAIRYFLREEPNFRKPNVIAAAIFLAAIDLGFMEEYYMSNSEVSKLFGVSTGSMTNHANNIKDYIFTILEEIKEEKVQGEDRVGPVFTKVVGTDPRMIERVNWEVFSRMSRKDFGTLDNVQAHLDSTMNEEFQPEGRKEQAQVLIYDAYDAENDRDRYRFAEQAATLDGENVDVILLKAEKAETDKDAERLYKNAIQSGEQRFEEVDGNPWGLVTNRPYMRALFKYGVWLYEREKYVESGSMFNKLLKLNPDDNQGARYLAIASFTHQENFDKALEILDESAEGSESDAVYLFLSWYFEASSTEGTSENLVWMFEEADAANPYVEAIIDSNSPSDPYPRSLDLIPGTMEEAKFIWTLIR